MTARIYQFPTIRNSSLFLQLVRKGVLRSEAAKAAQHARRPTHHDDKPRKA